MNYIEITSTMSTLILLIVSFNSAHWDNECNAIASDQVSCGITVPLLGNFNANVRRQKADD